MASFLGTLKTIGHIALGIANNPLTETAVTFYNPALGALLKHFNSSISNIEAAHVAAGKEKSGPEKLAFVMQDFEEGMSVTQEILKMNGKKLSYDTGMEQEAINAQVAALNAFKRFHDSIKIEDLPQTPPAA